MGHLLREKDRPGARAEEGASASSKFTETLVERFLSEKFPLRGAFAAGQNDGVHAGKIGGSAHKHVLDTEAHERRGVSFKISLNGQDSNFHLLSAHTTALLLPAARL